MVTSLLQDGVYSIPTEEFLQQNSGYVILFIINLTVPHNNTRPLHRMNSIITDKFCIQASCNQMENINWIKKVVFI